MAWPHLRRFPARRAVAPANHLSRSLRQRRLSVALCLRAGIGPDVLHVARIPRISHVALVGVVGHLSPPAAAGDNEPADLSGRLRGGRRASQPAKKQGSLVVAPNGGGALFPATDRARLGSLPGSLDAPARAARRPAYPGLRRPARRQTIARRSGLL